MAHRVESMMFKGQRPWHQLGVEIPEDHQLDVESAMSAAGLNWDVGLVPLSIAKDKGVPAELVGQKVPNRAVIRKTDNRVLGVVGPRFHPLQNLDAFKWFQPFLDSEEASFETAGSLCGGERVWVLARINRDPLVIQKNDEVLKYLLLSNSHDGPLAVRVGYSPVRTACANTLSMAHSNSASKLIRFRHSAALQKNLENIRETIDTVDRAFVASAEQFRLLVNRGINQADLENFVQISLKIPEDHGKISTRSKNIMEGVYRRFEVESGPSNWWKAYNAVNWYLNHEQGNKPDTRLNSLWFGTSAKTNHEALTLALKLSAS